MGEDWGAVGTATGGTESSSIEDQGAEHELPPEALHRGRQSRMIDYFPRTEIVPKSLAGGGEGSPGLLQ